MSEPVTYVWTFIRDRAVREFGEPPNREFEAQLIPVFQKDPAGLVAIIDGAVASVKAGRARSGWAVVRANLDALEPPEAVATAVPPREQALRYAAGVGQEYVEAEFRDDCFGEHGRYKRWPQLEAEVMDEWRRHAAVGQTG